MKKYFLICSILTMIVLQIGCASAKEGVWQIQTTKGQVTGLIKPEDGWVYDGFTNDTYPYQTRMFQYPVKVSGGTNDNAQVSMDINLSLEPPTNYSDVKRFSQDFGLEEDERWQRMTSFISAQLSAEAKKAIIKHDAYSLLKSQTAIEQDIKTSLEPILATKGIALKYVTVLNNPYFEDERIAKAASSVVANGKLKEAAEMALAAGRVEVETKALQAQSFSNPALLELEKLNMQMKIKQLEVNGLQFLADGIKNHQGTLVINGNAGAGMQLQLPLK